MLRSAGAPAYADAADAVPSLNVRVVARDADLDGVVPGLGPKANRARAAARASREGIEPPRSLAFCRVRGWEPAERLERCGLNASLMILWPPVVG